MEELAAEDASGAAPVAAEPRPGRASAHLLGVCASVEIEPFPDDPRRAVVRYYLEPDEARPGGLDRLIHSVIARPIDG